MTEVIEAAPTQEDERCATEAASAACVGCTAQAIADRQYAEHAFGPAQNPSRTVESIVDALGYCAPHGRLVAGHGERNGRVVQALHRVFAQLLTMLTDEATYGERLAELYFRAGRQCPACHFVERAATVSLSRLRPADGTPALHADRRLQHLCFPHFRRFYLGATAAQREDCFAAYRRGLQEAMAAQSASLSGGGGAVGPAGDILLSRIAGTALRHAGASLEPSATDGAARRVALPELLDADCCPVCHQVEAARARWQESIRLTLRTGQPPWLSFPSCAEHVHAAASLGDPAITATAAHHAAAVTLSILDRRLPPFAPPERGASGSAEPLPPRRWRGGARRRKAAAEPTAAARKAHAPTCLACEQLAVARDAAIGGLLDALHQSGHRDTYARGYGLCVRHFAQAHLFAGGQQWRAFLREIQVERLQRMQAALAQFVDPAALPGAGPPADRLGEVVRGALARLGGTLAAPPPTADRR